MLHSAIPAQAVIDLAHENQGVKFVFGVSWKHMNKTLQSGKCFVLKDILLFACSVQPFFAVKVPFLLLGDD